MVDTVRPFSSAPGRAHSLEGVSPLQARQGELLADGKGVCREAESEGSRYGKALAQRTETAYEADASGKKARIFKAQSLHGRCGRKCGGYKREGECALPGEICVFAFMLGAAQVASMNTQKSAAGIVGRVRSV
jgi:hypothetical protein